MYQLPQKQRSLQTQSHKLRWFFLAGLLVFLPISWLHADTPHAKWFAGPFQQAINTAKAQKKLVFLDMYADWCYPCKRMEREVFSQPNVSQYLGKHFVSVKSNGMYGEGRWLAQRYNCVTYPCMLVINEQGKEIGRLTRFTAARPFVERLRELRQNKNTLADLLPQLQRNPKDPILHFRVGFRYAYRGDKRCIQHLHFTAQNPTAQAPHLAAKALYILGRIYYRNTLRDCASANRIFQMYMKRFPQGADVQRVNGLYQRCLRRLRR
ncbi:MAG: thioredoxin family protein [Myxococcales bacterium]|nr:thioredoxin family protein [Myxococcales bacterium]